ncbi:MAG: hypothetical protein AAGB32_04550 [Pseudomonadota bacterium]
MTIQKKQFGTHSKDNGDEWWFHLARDTDNPTELFVIYETEFGGKRSERKIPIHEYLGSGERGTSKLIEMIGTLID